MSILPTSLRQIARDLGSQKLRTFLTVFGIIWGTAAVSLLLSFGQALERQMTKASAGLGPKIVIAWPSLTSIPFEGLGKGRRIRLAERDVELLRERADAVGAISAEYESMLRLQYESVVRAVPVSGISAEFGRMRNLIPAAGGRFVNPLDDEQRRRVVFLGDELAGQVFGDVDPVGRTLRLNGSPFLVVGVMQEKIQNSNYSGPDERRAYIPAATFRSLTGQRYLDQLIFEATDVSQTPRAIEQVGELLAARHRFDPGDEEALQVWDVTEMMQFMGTFMLAFNLFLGIVGSLTLVVGGIGVSNIMNVVVEERTREIGVKMALGARPRTILSHVMIETSMIIALGGTIGIGLTAALCAVFPAIGVSDFVGEPAVSPAVAAITIGLLGSIGLLAGWFPARAASRLDPVVAMKT